ncbi:hypothetical protein GCM10023213_19850 [Prosthecobacter algae]|uniref:Uncharacterized protein n=2 Tax=Prosthecobacter algae TaxID=1144682 RepID=A0ABP9P2G3_9BACT
MSDIPSDLAAKVIGADLRNLVKKVSDGSVLSTPEREMMEQATIQGALPDELQAARLAALMRRYAQGKPLTKDQQRELSLVLPSNRPIVKRITTESYRHKLSHYVPVLGLKGKDPERKLKRWIAAGREKSPPDLPPFDQPQLMPEWWRRNMTWKVPDYIQAFEQQAADATPEAATAERLPDPQQAPTTTVPGKPAEAGTEQTGVPMFLDMGAEVSSDVGLQQVRALVQATFNQLQRCLESGHVTQANSYRREWQTLVGTLRQWEKDIVKIQEGKGEVLRTRVINTELVRILTVMRHSFSNALLEMAEILAPQMEPSERRDMSGKLRDKCFSHLKATRFSQVYQQLNEGHD